MQKVFVLSLAAIPEYYPDIVEKDNENFMRHNLP
jgi:hypothetical protein